MTMKNGDMPAMPLDRRAALDLDEYCRLPQVGFMPRGIGLTKREYFAVKAMEGLLASHENSYLHASINASHAVQHADALLAELAKEQGDGENK